MGYSCPTQVDLVLGQALTSASPLQEGVRVPLTDIGNIRNQATILDSVVNQYISYADQQIDAAISQMYVTPLSKCVSGQWVLTVDIYEYNPYVIVGTAANFVVGDEIFLIDDESGVKERHFVKTVIDEHTVETVSDIEGDFSGNSCRVIRIQYPSPIGAISSRLAASFVYDKYFSAQASPNMSDYGNMMRQVAYAQLDDILNGRTILKNQDRIGDMWGNPWLDDTYAHRDRGYHTQDRNIGRPGNV